MEQEQRERREAEERKQSGNDEERQGLLGGLFARDRPEENPNREKRARDESFFGALVLNLCPTVRCCTFTVFIIFIDIIMFLISIWIYRIINTELLAPNPRALDLLGWKDARKIKKRG